MNPINISGCIPLSFYTFFMKSGLEKNAEQYFDKMNVGATPELPESPA